MTTQKEENNSWYASKSLCYQLLQQAINETHAQLQLTGVDDDCIREKITTLFNNYFIPYLSSHTTHLSVTNAWGSVTQIDCQNSVYDIICESVRLQGDMTDQEDVFSHVKVVAVPLLLQHKQ